MSKFPEYYEYACNALACLDGDLPPSIYGEFSLRDTPLQYPIHGILSFEDCSQFYQSHHQQVQGSLLDSHRKELYRSFVAHMYWAHRTVVTHVPGPANVSDLREPLSYVVDALECMEKLRDLDRKHPVTNQHIIPAAWRTFQLESLALCLKFCVRLLELIWPDRFDFWEECQRNLAMDDWHKQFSYETREGIGERASRHTMADVLKANQKGTKGGTASQ